MFKKLLSIIIILCNTFFVFSQVKFVCIGNSITHGSTAAGVFSGTTIGDSLTEMSYRFWFWEKVDSAGIIATMVGYQTTYFNQGSSLTSKSRYTGHTFVNNHEGYYGIKSDGFLAGGWGGCPDFDTRLAGFSAPDVALIHICTNDDTTLAAVNASEANMRSIIQKLRNRNPNVTVLLAKTSSFWKPQNNRIDGIASTMTTTNSVVYPVDIAYDFFYDNVITKKNSLLLDGVHPNAKGQKLMALRWFEAYMKITKADSIKPPVPGNLYASAMTASSIDLKWDASADNTGVNLYKIYMNDSLIATTKDLTYTVTGINTSAKTYYFKISAVDFQKNESTKSTIKAPSSVTFNVTDGASPISGAAVTFNSVNQNTDGTGKTTFNNIRPSTFNYTVKAANFKNLSFRASIKNDTTISIVLSGVSLPDEDNELKIYPNPASDRINIENAAGSRFEIVNEVGDVVLQMNCTDDICSIDCSSLIDGMYAVRITMKNKLYIRKIKINK